MYQKFQSLWAKVWNKLSNIIKNSGNTSINLARSKELLNKFKQANKKQQIRNITPNFLNGKPKNAWDIYLSA